MKLKKCRVAVAQIKVGEVKRNVRMIKRYVQRASEAKADIVVFPETCVYVYASQNPIDFDKYLSEIKEECKRNKIWCIFTSYTLQKGKKHNTAFLIDRNGEVFYRYNKKHPWISETDFVTAGKSISVIDTGEFGKIGIIICSDIGYPHEIRKLSRDGAWIVFCPTYDTIKWETSEIHSDLPLIRAYDNACYFIHCDAFTDETVSISTIASPMRILKRIKNKSGIIVADLDYNLISKLKLERLKSPLHE